MRLDDLRRHRIALLGFGVENQALAYFLHEHAFESRRIKASDPAEKRLIRHLYQ